MEIQPSHISCGIKQLWNLGSTPLTKTGEGRDWKAGLRGVQKHFYTSTQGCNCAACREITRNGGGLRPTCLFIIFSDADNYKNGINFSQWLRDQKLGKVTEVCSGVNPNTQSQIRLWSWELPESAEFNAFMSAPDVAMEKKAGE